jgi:hypothetical protein
MPKERESGYRVRFVLAIYRNTGPGQFLNRSLVQLITFKASTGESISVSDAIHLHIRLSRGWKHKAGQYTWSESYVFRTASPLLYIMVVS